MRAVSKISDTDLEQRIQEMAKPGVVFGEPFRDGKMTIIPVSRVKARPDRLVASPVGAILIGPQGVELRRFSHPAGRILTLAMVAAIIFWLGMLMHPAWKPDVTLLQQVRELIKTIREKPRA
jgi:hypothetical protein